MEREIFQNGDYENVINVLLSDKSNADTLFDDGSFPLYLASEAGDREMVNILLSAGADVHIVKQPEGKSALFISCALGHLSVVERLFHGGAALDSVNHDGATPLWISCSNGHLSVAEYLISKGASTILVDNKGASPLWAASSKGRVAVVERLFASGAILDLASNDGCSPLKIASQWGHLPVVEYLLSNGAAVDLVDEEGASPLWTASAEGRAAVVAYLASHGAAIDLADNDGWSPLNIAAQCGHLEVVEDLLSNGAGVDLVDENGASPLYGASSKGRLAIVELLLSKGADIERVQKDGHSPLMVSSRNGHLSVVKFLISKGAFVDIEDREGASPLWAASSCGHLPVVEVLVANGANPNLLDIDDWSPLNIASQNGHLSVVEFLFSKGAAVDSVDKDGWSPLTIAAFKGRLPVVKLLLSKGATIDLLDKSGCSPLNIAAKNGHLSVVEQFLVAGASVDLVDKEGSTSLWAACACGHLPVVECLVSNGAVLDMLDFDGWSPLAIAAHNGHDSVVDFLLSKGASVDSVDKGGVTPLIRASVNGHLSVVESLVGKGASLGAVEKKGVSALWAASSKGQLNVVEFFVSQCSGTLVEAVNSKGVSALFVATFNGHLPVAEYLISQGARVNKSCADGRSPLHAASESGQLALAELLADSGADIESESNILATPLWTASFHGHQSVAEFLLSRGAHVNRPSDDGTIPLWYASYNNHVQVVELLLANGSLVDQSNCRGETPLFGAAAKGHFAVVDLLFAHRASLDKAMSGGKGFWGVSNRLFAMPHLKSVWREAIRLSPVRVTLFGPPGSGKTTLCSLLKNYAEKNRNAVFPDANLATDGIQVSSLGGITVWDFGGQEVLHSTHQFFFSEESQIVVVVDAHRFSSSAEHFEYLRDLRYWVDLACRWSTPRSPPIIVVVTHCDLLIARDGLAALRTAKAEICSFITIHGGFKNVEFFEIARAPDGSLSRLPLSKIFAAINGNADKYVRHQRGLTKQSRGKFCHVNFRLRQRLEDERAKGVKFVWWSKYLQYCRDCSIREGDADTVNSATNFLVNFGAIVTYRQASTGAPSLVVLDPKWLASAFTSIVSIKFTGTEQHRGFLTRSSLESRWRELSLAEDSWPQLMNMFSMFQLAVRLPDGRHFVPSLLRTPKVGGAPLNSEGRDALLASKAAITLFGRTMTLSPSIPSGFFDRLVVRLLHFPGVDVVEEGTWIDDYLLSVPFGWVRLQQFPEKNVVLLTLACAPGCALVSPRLAFFSYFYFDSPRTLLASYFSEVCIQNQKAIFGESVYEETALRQKALSGQEVVESPDLALPGIRRYPEEENVVLQSVLDEGTYGVVYRAKLLGTAVPNPRVIVVKFLKNIAGLESRQRDFFREALTMARLEPSPYLVRLLGVVPSLTRGGMGLAIEYARYGNLTVCHEVLRSSMGEWLKLKLAYDLARGLRDLHSSEGLKLIHRDVRSQNFFIFCLDEREATISSEVVHGKLGDFGTVVVASPNYGEDLGNFQYMAPEAFRGALAVPYSGAVDVYSFGILMWEIFHGEPPYKEYILNAEEGRQSILDGARPVISTAVSTGVAELMSICWASDPQLRPNFEDVVERLAVIFERSQNSLHSMKILQTLEGEEERQEKLIQSEY